MDSNAVSVENMCNLLIRSRLLQPADVHVMNRRWRLEAREAHTDVERFARWMVEKQYVTEYQAQSILRGHADHFFLNHYKLLDRIGKGRMAGVFKAVHNLGNVVAVKVLPPSKGREPQVLGRFQREARMAVKLNHANVVRSFHMGHASGLHYLVMEFLEGETLEDVLKRRGKLPIAEGVRLIHQTLQGLQHIHEQGLVHRDLKPGNMMLVPAPTAGAPDTTLGRTVKILDIGLGRALFDEDVSTEMEEMQLTSEGAMLGTPDYLAPEQARDAHKADIRADIYSIGCVLYHILTGSVPFPEKNVLEQIMKHTKATARPMRELEPSIPEALQQVVSKMLAKDPAQRYQTPAQAAQALQGFMGGQEPLRPAEAAPQSYLSWVSQVGEEEEPSAAPARPGAVAVASAPAARPGSPPPAPRAAVPPPPPPVRGGAAVVPPPPPRPAARALAAPSDASIADADVELVTMAPGGAPVPETPASMTAERVRRRDLLILGIGFWLGAAVVLLIGGIVWLVRSR